MCHCSQWTVRNFPFIAFKKKLTEDSPIFQMTTMPIKSKMPKRLWSDFMVSFANTVTSFRISWWWYDCFVAELFYICAPFHLFQIFPTDLEYNIPELVFNCIFAGCERSLDAANPTEICASHKSIHRFVCRYSIDPALFSLSDEYVSWAIDSQA